ncbi:MAG: HAMP domain-containing histidine kinase [Lachnospiraceae bacterium]|nr:HAMP domain-containing histidine kinase [Lachnospiraceae bacterium]
MIKTLRRKFIAAAMCSVAAVLFLLIGSINLANYINVDKATDARLDILAENGGSFPRTSGPELFKDPKPDMAPHRKMSAETPFDTRFFTVTLKADGTIVSVDTGKIAAISTEDACSYAQSLFQKDSREGYSAHYKYRAVSVTGTLGEQNTMYIFLDCQRELDTFQNFLFISILASLFGMFLVLLLVIFFSKILVRPIAESYEKQKRFITDASHELKTPLAIIDANTEVLEMESGENEWTASIHNQVRRLTSLTQKLVFLSRMDEGGASSLTMVSFSLSDAVEETARPFEPLAATGHKRMTLDIASDLTLHGDEASIRQLVSLLLDNAIKYCPEGGSIELCLKETGRNKILTVRNTARGLTPGRQDILFDRFYRPDSSRSLDTGGFGIGLSVAQAIVTAHKGRITARSEDGNSILFTIIFPPF